MSLPFITLKPTKYYWTDQVKVQFKDKSAGRYYVAVIMPPLKDDVTVEAKIARNPKNRGKIERSKTIAVPVKQSC